MVAEFRDHLVVCRRIKLEAPLLRGGRSMWKMNMKLLEDKYLKPFSAGVNKIENAGRKIPVNGYEVG